MQVVNLDLEHWNLYCPVTGQKISGDGIEPNFPPSIKGLWVGEIADTPEIKDSALQKAWEEFVNDLDEESFLEPEDINGFFANYNAPNWVTFYICSGTAFFNDSAWYVIDMNTHSE